MFVFNTRWKRGSALFNILYMCSSCTYFKSLHSSCIQVPQSTMSWAAEDAVPLQLYSFLSFIIVLKNLYWRLPQQVQTACSPLLASKYALPNITLQTPFKQRQLLLCRCEEQLLPYSLKTSPLLHCEKAWEMFCCFWFLSKAVPLTVFAPDIIQHKMEITPFTLHQHTLHVVLAEMDTAHIRP